MSNSPPPPHVVLPRLVWLPTPNESSRHGVRPDLGVLHETAGSYAGAVSWLRNPLSEVSSTFVLREDGLEVTQLVALARKPWTQGTTFNPRSISIELANKTAKGYHSEFQLAVAARMMGWITLQSGYAIPPRWSRQGKVKGYTYHGDLGAAGSSHPHCGPDERGWHLFLDWLAYEIERGDYKKVWAKK